MKDLLETLDKELAARGRTIDDFARENSDMYLTIATLNDQIDKLVKANQELVAELEEWKKQDCEHRCGGCDNGMWCNIHDCPSNPNYSESQMCDGCGFCKNPQDDSNPHNGGPCEPCKCKTPVKLVAKKPIN